MNGPIDTLLAVLRENAVLITLILVVWVAVAVGVFYFRRAVIRSALRPGKDERGVQSGGPRTGRSD